ncbi:hypothetical protein PG993_011316 [Apiospora rasikravindrae]|uniref:Uncharacterized protein n=1 Tax=Apiospora rasikravindrae TaxID=990691 RepID=A0ABR1SDY6_9PEZI
MTEAPSLLSIWIGRPHCPANNDRAPLVLAIRGVDQGIRAVARSDPPAFFCHATHVEPDQRIPVWDLEDYIQRANHTGGAQCNQPQKVGPGCDLLQGVVVCQLLQWAVSVVLLDDPELGADFAEGFGEQRRVHDVELLWRVAGAQYQEHGHHRPGVVCDEAGVELGARELPHPDGDSGRHADLLDGGCLPWCLPHDSCR